MADKCPHCGAANPEQLPFCNECGEPIDQDLRLIMEVKQTAQTKRTAEKPRVRYDDDDPMEEEDEDDEDRRPRFLLWVILLLAVAACIWFFLR